MSQSLIVSLETKVLSIGRRERKEESGESYSPVKEESRVSGFDSDVMDEEDE